MADPQQAVRMHEPPRVTPVRGAFDVVVCGGGLGGVAAALAAARAGARVALVERNGFLGGVATAGMCCSVFNCFYTSERRLGVTGIAVEVTDALARATGYGCKWHAHKGHIIYDTEAAKLVLARLLDEAGVVVLLETLVVAAVKDENRVRGVVVESKSGREALLAQAVVDASGDADVAAQAGVPLHTKGPALHSFCFRLGQVNVDRFVQYFIDHPGEYPEYMDVDWTFGEALQQYCDTGTFLFPHGGPMQMRIFREARAAGEYPERLGLHDTLDACQMHAIRELGVVHVITGFVRFSDLDIGTISRAIHDGRRMAFVVSDFFRRRLPGFEASYIVGTADDLGIRASRWCRGEFAFTKAMRTSPARFPDRIGRGVVQIDVVKHPGKNAWGVQTFTPETFDIPYRCLVPRQVDGLVFGAGRSVSAEDPFLLRTMVLTMVVGQGAGTAAATAARQGTPLRDVDVGLVQAELRRQGVELND